MRKGGKLLLLFVLASVAGLQAAANAPCPIERAAAHGSRVWLLCDERELLASQDSGQSWQSIALPSGARYRSIAFLDERRGFIVGDAGTLLASDDGGKTWTQIPLPVKDNLTWIHFSGEFGWISGWSGVMLHTSDGGKSWALQNTGVTQGLESVYFTDPQHGWAVGWSGVIIRTTDGGKTWQRANTLMNFWSLSAVYFRDPMNGWAVGFNGQILRTKDGGINWEELKSPVRSRLTSITFDRQGRGWITANNDLLVSEDGGETWSNIPVQQVLFLRQALPVGESLWAVGRFGILERAGSSGEFRSIASLPRRSPEGS